MLVFDYTKPPLNRMFSANRDFFKGRKDCKIILNERQYERLREELFGGFIEMRCRNIILEVKQDEKLD